MHYIKRGVFHLLCYMCVYVNAEGGVIMETQKRGITVFSFSAVAILIVAASLPSFASGLKGQLYLTPGVEEYNLLVKFSASTGPDLDANSKLIFRHRAPLAKTTAQQSALSMNFRRVITFTPEEMTRIKSDTRLSLPGRVDIIEFSGMMYVEVPGGDKNRLLQLGQELESLEEVEYCSLQPALGPPPPVATDIPPTTPDFTNQQGWLGPDPGSDFRYAWTVNALGQGVTVRDIEDSWGRLNHEDFDSTKLAYVLPAYTTTYDFHGISIFGEIFGQHNSYGIDGGAPEALGRCYSFQTSATTQNRPAAMTRMVTDSRRGDVILLEMQASGPDGNLCPADIDQTIWDLTKRATDSGVVVIGTAGNGGANMDAAAYASYRARGDNGVIMEGAGSSNTSHTRLSFSSYGAPVHVQGWGQNVATTSTGSYANLANLPTGSPDGRQGYTSSFSGTSSGGGHVAAAAASLQSYALQRLGRPLAPREMRTIFISTGIPQGGTEHIGPLPNLRAATRWVDSLRGTEVVPKDIKNEIITRGLYYSNGMIHYNIPGSAKENYRVTISLFDLKGSLVKTLINEQKSSGQYKVDLQQNTDKLTFGIYLCSMKVADSRYTTRIVVR